jgi:hypothetical protein
MKHQIPSSNIQRISKHQAPMRAAEFGLDVEVWSFSGAWMLVLGAFYL